MKLTEFIKDLFEQGNIENKLFYHGSENKITQDMLLPSLMYFTDDYNEAVAYSIEKHQIKTPNVISAKLSMKNILTDVSILEALMSKMGYDPNNFLSGEIIEFDGVVDKLKTLGYDSAIVSDLGFSTDFGEFDAYIVFDAKNQVKIVENFSNVSK